jgi:hypothetical protein
MDVVRKGVEKVGGTVTIEGGGPEKAAPVLRAHTKNVRKNLQMELGEELSL